MKRIASNEELAGVHNRGLGLVYNDFTKAGSPKYNVLHAAWCPWLAKSNITYDKIFFESEHEAVSWLEENRGMEGEGWKRCGGPCYAKTRTQASAEYTKHSVAQTIRGTSLKETTEPFTEDNVQSILTNYLRKQGYEINTRVPCPSGYIDLVATKGGQSIIVEVKGEDQGGYTSAEMNFQMGFGQIISRMIDPKARYALAIPITNHYLRVLRKYRDSFGLMRLDCSFFLIHEDGDVESYTAEGLSKFITDLK